MASRFHQSTSKTSACERPPDLLPFLFDLILLLFLLLLPFPPSPPPSLLLLPQIFLFLLLQPPPHPPQFLLLFLFLLLFIFSILLLPSLLPLHLHSSSYSCFLFSSHLASSPQTDLPPPAAPPPQSSFDNQIGPRSVALLHFDWEIKRGAAGGDRKEGEGAPSKTHFPASSAGGWAGLVTAVSVLVTEIEQRRSG